MSPRAARSIRAVTGEGKIGRANTCEPLVDASLSKISVGGMCGGVQGLAAAKRQTPAGKWAPVREEHRCPRGTEGAHPDRSSDVRNAETASRSGLSVWQADREEGWIPRRAKDDREANAGGRKAAGNHRG